MLQPLTCAEERFSVGGGDDISFLDLPGAVHVNGVVWPEGVPRVRSTLVGHDAGQPVHSSQVKSGLFDFKAVCVKLTTGFHYLHVAVAFDIQIVEDKEAGFLLVDLVVDGGLQSLWKVRIKLGVILPDLLGPILEGESPEDGDAGVHHVNLVKVLHLDPCPGRPSSSALRVMTYKEVRLTSLILFTITWIISALLTTHRPVAALAPDEGGGGCDLLVAAQTHWNSQLLGTNNHRTLIKD